MTDKANVNTYKDIDYSLFDKILSVNDFRSYNMLEFGKFVYEATYTTYRSQWIQEWQEVQRVSELLVSKNILIEEQQNTIAQLKLKLSDYEEVEGVIKEAPTGEQVPEETGEETEGDVSNVLRFGKGSKGDKGNTRPPNCS